MFKLSRTKTRSSRVNELPLMTVWRKNDRQASRLVCPDWVRILKVGVDEFLLSSFKGVVVGSGTVLST